MCIYEWDFQDVAMQKGDTMQAEEIQAQIDDLDSRAGKLDEARSKRLEVISIINQRNRNIMKETFLGGIARSTSFEDSQDDPFTRKSMRMKVVSGSAKAKMGDATIPAEELKPNMAGSSKSFIPNLATSLTAPLPAADIKGLLPEAKDLFSAHDVAIDIQLKLPSKGFVQMNDTQLIATQFSPASFELQSSTLPPPVLLIQQ